MAKYRLVCDKCGWSTKPYYSVIDCIKEKERAHFSNGVNAFDAHDRAFDSDCPQCGAKTREEYKYFK